MRDILTILAGLVIAMLAAAVAVPPFVDWGAHRELVETALTRVTGIAVATEGAIDVRLLPSPRLRIERLRLGSDTPGGASLLAAFVRTEVALTPLLHGEVRFVETRVGRAEITLPTGAGGAWRVPRRLIADAMLRREWVFEDLAARQLLVTTRDPATGRTDQAYGEEVEVQAQSLAGPWHLRGRTAGSPFEIATGELAQDGTFQLKVTGGGGTRPRLDFDGRVTLRPSSGETLVPGLTGTAKLAIGAPSKAGAEAIVPVTITAGIKLAGETGEFDGISVEAGEGASSLRLGGSGRLDLRQPRLTLDLEGRRFDADAFLASAGAGSSTSGPNLGFVRRWPGLPSLPIDLSLKLDALALAGEEFSALALQGGVEGERIRIGRLDAVAPGSTRVNASGDFRLGAMPGGSGHVELTTRSADRLSGLARALGMGEFFASLGPRAASVSTDLNVAEPVISLPNLRVTLGDARLTGALRLTAPEGAGRGRLDAQLAIQGLDLREVPPLSGVFAAARTTDLGLILDARGVGYGTASGSGRIAARLQSDDAGLRIDRLELADVAGANANLSGRIAEDGTGRLDGRLTAKRAAPLIDLAGEAWIGGASRLLPTFLRDGGLDLTVMAERLSPQNSGPGFRTVLAGTAAGGGFEAETRSAAGRLTQLTAKIATSRLETWIGSSGGTRPASLTISGARPRSGRMALDVTGDLAGAGIRTLRPLVLGPNEDAVEEGALALAADDAAPLAPLLGENIQLASPLPAQLEISLGRREDRRSVGIRGRVAGSGVEASLSGAPGELTGRVTLDRLSVPALVSALALGAPSSGAGREIWPSARFGPVPMPRFGGTVSVRAEQLDLGAGWSGRTAAVDVALSAEGLSLRNVAVGLNEGRLNGEVTIRREGGLASLSGQGGLRDVSLSEVLPGGIISGRLSGDLRFGGSGESVAAILAGLGGAGSFRFGGLEIARADPGAAGRSGVRALRSDDPLAAPRLREIANEELDRGAFRADTVSAPVTLIGGAIRMVPLFAEAGEGAWSGSVSLDFKNFTLDASGLLRSKLLPKGWSGEPPALLLGWRGPVARPARSVDVAPLVNGLATAVLTRELDRIDTFEADQNERRRRASQSDMDRERRAAEERARLAAQRAREEAERARAAERERAEDAPASTTAVPPPVLPPRPELRPGG